MTVENVTVRKEAVNVCTNTYAKVVTASSSPTGVPGHQKVLNVVSMPIGMLSCQEKMKSVHLLAGAAWTFTGRKIEMVLNAKVR